MKRQVTILIGILLYGLTLLSPTTVYADTNYDTALSYYYAGDYDKAATMLEEMTDDSANNRNFLLSMVYLKQKHTEKAQELFLKVDLEILNIEDYADLVALQFFPNQADEVVQRILKKVDKTYPKKTLSFQLYLEAGNQYFKRKNWKKAEELFLNAANQEVDTATTVKAYLALIELSLNQNAYAKAFDYYKNLILTSPKIDQDLSLLKQIQTASSTPRTLADLFPTAESQLRFFRIAYEKEAYAIAKKQGVYIIDKYPHMASLAEVCTHTGLCCFLTSEYHQAIDLFQYTKKHFPNTTWANKSGFYIARSYQKMNQLTKAKELFLNIIAQSNTKEYVAESYYYLYWIFLASNQESGYTPYFLEFRKKFSNNDYLDKVIWELAWKQTLKGNYSDAYALIQAQSWTKSQDQFKSKLLFWAGKMNNDLNLNKAKFYYKKCVQTYPFSYYSYRIIQTYFPEQKNSLGKQFRSIHIPTDEMGMRLYRLGLGDIAISYLKSQFSTAKKNKQTIAYTLCTIQAKMGDYYRSIHSASTYGLSLDKQEGYIPSEIAQLLYPRPHWNKIQAYSKEFKMDPYFVLAVIREESNFNTQSKSRVGATGLMQIMPSTGKGIAEYLNIPWEGPDTLKNPDYNIRCGTYYLACLKTKLGSQYETILAGYNAGPNATKKWVTQLGGKDIDWFVATIPYTETHYYVTKVLKSYWIYKLLYS